MNLLCSEYGVIICIVFTQCDACLSNEYFNININILSYIIMGLLVVVVTWAWITLNIVMMITSTNTNFNHHRVNHMRTSVHGHSIHYTL
jgi:hypothetical protein